VHVCRGGACRERPVVERRLALRQILARARAAAPMPERQGRRVSGKLDLRSRTEQVVHPACGYGCAAAPDHEQLRREAHHQHGGPATVQQFLAVLVGLALSAALSLAVRTFGFAVQTFDCGQSSLGLAVPTLGSRHLGVVLVLDRRSSLSACGLAHGAMVPPSRTRQGEARRYALGVVYTGSTPRPEKMLGACPPLG
jgi:hypothetical protein